MALKILKVLTPQVSSGVIFTNTSNAFILIIGWNADFSGVGGWVQVQDPQGNAYARALYVKAFSESFSVSESGSFSTTASTSQGITSTSESISGSINGDFLVYVKGDKLLLPPNFSLNVVGVVVYGFLAIQADSLEELRGFL